MTNRLPIASTVVHLLNKAGRLQGHGSIGATVAAEPHALPQFFQVVSGSHLDQLNALPSAKAAFAGVPPLHLLEGFFSAEKGDGAVILRPLVFEGHHEARHEDVEVLVAEPLGAGVLMDLDVGECGFEVVVELGLGNPSLADTGDAFVLPEIILGMAGELGAYERYPIGTPSTIAISCIAS
jgi:hypothetical protein